MLKDDLQIILITYNRKPYLENTLKQILSDDSPIKDLDITVLDNCSTDGTTELVAQYADKYSNIKHIRHNRNIGGNGNIARAFEIADKKYLWILCDDDEYHFENWKYIQEGLDKDSDVVFTELSNFKYYKNDASIYRAATFLPATIYKTNLITMDVLLNAEANIINLFPHLAVMSYALNENKNIFIPEKAVIEVGNRPDNAIETGFYSSKKENTHPYVRDMFLIVGIVNSVQMIKDKKRRKFILDHISAKNTGFFREISANFKRNRMYYNNSFKNICDVFCGVSFSQKIQFIFALVWLDVIYFIKKYILRNKKYWVK